jgi:hypothetical protein
VFDSTSNQLVRLGNRLGFILTSRWIPVSMLPVVPEALSIVEDRMPGSAARLVAPGQCRFPTRKQVSKPAERLLATNRVPDGPLENSEDTKERGNEQDDDQAFLLLVSSCWNNTTGTDAPDFLFGSALLQGVLRGQRRRERTRNRNTWCAPAVVISIIMTRPPPA